MIKRKNNKNKLRKMSDFELLMNDEKEKPKANSSIIICDWLHLAIKAKSLRLAITSDLNQGNRGIKERS
jgi:hypothetical protein